MSPQLEDMVIVGTGPAGLTAAIYGARSGISPLVFAGTQPGGQLTTTTDVENFPGFAEGILGPQLMENMTTQATRVGARIQYHHIDAVGWAPPSTTQHPTQQAPLKKLVSADGQEILAKTVILCTGATAKTLNLPQEATLMGHGLSTCATCDGFFYRHKIVAVVGGGDSAMEESLFLANLAKKVYLIHRRDGFRASHIMLERARQHPNIEFCLPYEVSELVSEPNTDIPALSGIIMNHTTTNQPRQLELHGLFYAIGHTPNSQIFKPWVDTDDQGYILVQNEVNTKTPGVYAAGDVCDPHYKQAITAAGLGCKAAMSAIRLLDEVSWEL